VLRGKKGIDGRLRLKFSNNACQRGPIVVNFGFLHPSLAVLATKEVKHFGKGLLGIIHHVGKCPALAVLKKNVPGDDNGIHFALRSCSLGPMQFHFTQLQKV
jgi:hypothetical protein